MKVPERLDRERCDLLFHSSNSRFPNEFPTWMPCQMDILSRIVVTSYMAVDHLKHGRCD